MDELSLHILDIVQNSVSAKANLIKINVTENNKEDFIIIEIEDNGVGIDEKDLEKVQDPFFTTKKEKKVGLGIPLFKQIALTCDGEFNIESKKNLGTKIYAKFKKSHPDLPPLGDLKNTILTLILSIKNCDFIFFYNKDNRIFEIDTREIKKNLGDTPLNHPEVINFLKEFFEENFKKMEVNSET